VNGIFLDSLNHALVILFIFLGLVIFSYYLVNETWVLFVGLILVSFSGNPVKKGMLSTLFYMLERKDNPKYQIANMVQDNGLQPASQNPQPEISTIRSKMSLKNIIIAAAKDISEYPTSMNIITVTVITDVLMQKHGNWEYYPLSLLLVIFYTVFLVFKEIFFLHKIYSNRVVEKKFMNYIK
jgi:hypothetical protein